MRVVRQAISVLIEQIRQGFKGHQWTDADIGRQEHTPVDADRCKSWIEHSIKELEEWILKSGPKGSQYHPLDFPNKAGEGGLRGKRTLYTYKERISTLSAVEGGIAQRKVSYCCKTSLNCR